MKDLNKSTAVMLIWDIRIGIWDMALATYKFYKGRVVIGILLVAIVCLLVYSCVSLLKAKWDAYALADWHDRFFAYLKGLKNENESKEITD